MDHQMAGLFVRRVTGLQGEEINGAELVARLPEEFNASAEDIEWWMELMDTGSFRAAMMIAGRSMPKSNLCIEDEPVMAAAFSMYWIEQKGTQDYIRNYKYRTKPFQ